jgi:hypothetical protein
MGGESSEFLRRAQAAQRLQSGSRLPRRGVVAHSILG